MAVRRICGAFDPAKWTCCIVTTSAGFLDCGDAERAIGGMDADIVLMNGAWLRAVGGALQVKGSVPCGVLEIIAKSHLIHFHTLWSPLSLALYQWARWAGVPYVISPHGMLDKDALSRNRLRKQIYLGAFEGRIIRNAARILYTSKMEQDSAELGLSEFPEGRVVPLGADVFPIGEREQLRKEFHESIPGIRNRPIFLHIGRIHEIKAIDRVITAIGQIVPRFPQVCYVVAGSGDRQYQSDLEAAARSAGVADNVRFVGFVSGRSKLQILAAADILVLASYHENFGIAVAEAMHASVPVVVSKGVGLWPSVQEHRAGIVVGAGVDPAEIASALISILEDAQRARVMGQSGFELARGSLTWSAAAERTAAVYEEVFEARDDRPAC